jgi:hypothetical protein
VRRSEQRRRSRDEGRLQRRLLVATMLTVPPAAVTVSATTPSME